MNILVVIPARGNSKGIPKKNVRLMFGKPLIVYSIENALSLKDEFSVDVVVDTDDTEIAEIAEQNDVHVVMRPAYLAQDDVTLDPVIYHATCEREKCTNVSYDIVTTMQATSPTLRSDSLHRAIREFIREDWDTLISGIDDRHLTWRYKENTWIPNYDKRVNRQYLDKCIKESGGFLITKRRFVTSDSRIGKRVSIFQLTEAESIDIDTDYDWKKCEAILASKKIIFRVDGEEQLGMGHIYRCLSLAYHLTGHELLFVSSSQYSLGIEYLRKSYFPLKIIENNTDIYSIIEKFKPDIIVNDILDTSEEYMLQLKKYNVRIINFEDIGEGACYADCVINALYPNKTGLNVYNDFRYFFIRDEFLTVTPKPFSRQVQNVVILFGGSDPSDLTRKTYGILQKISDNHPEIEFHIITGFGYKYKKEVISDIAHNIYVHNDVKRVSKYLAKADLAITAQGRTIFEVAYMGVPAVVLAQNSREVEHVFANIANGFINLGIGDSVEEETIYSTIEWLIRTPNVRLQMRTLLLGKDLHKGQERVIELILGDNHGKSI